MGKINFLNSTFKRNFVLRVWLQKGRMVRKELVKDKIQGSFPWQKNIFSSFNEPSLIQASKVHQDL